MTRRDAAPSVIGEHERSRAAAIWVEAAAVHQTAGKTVYRRRRTCLLRFSLPPRKYCSEDFVCVSHSSPFKIYLFCSHNLFTYIFGLLSSSMKKNEKSIRLKKNPNGGETKRVDCVHNIIDGNFFQFFSILIIYLYRSNAR